MGSGLRLNVNDMRTTQRNLLVGAGALMAILVIGFGLAAAQDTNETNMTTDSGDAIPGEHARAGHDCPDKTAAVDDAVTPNDAAESAL